MKSLSNAVSKRIGDNINTLTWVHGNIALPFVATKEHMNLLYVLQRLKVKEAIKLYTSYHMYLQRDRTYRFTWPYMENGVQVTVTADISVAGERDEELYLLFRNHNI